MLSARQSGETRERREVRDRATVDHRLHQLGIAHLDLKPQNVLLPEGYLEEESSG